MKKSELLALGLNDEAAEKVEAAIAEFIKGNGDYQKGYVPYARFKEVNDEKTALKESLKERDKQIDDLKNSTDIDGLKKQISDLQTANKAKDEEHAAAIKALKIDTAIDAALTAAKARNIKAVKGLLDLEDADLAKDGTVKGLADQIKKLVEGEDTSFLFDPADASSPKPNVKGAKPADAGTQKPTGEVDFAKMTYEELAAYMEANPNVEIPETPVITENN